MDWERVVSGRRAALAAAVFLFTTQAAHATMVDVFEASAYLDWDQNAGPQSLYEQGLGDPFLAPRPNEFAAGGFGTTFTTALTDGIGEVVWTITNNTGAAITNVEFFGFMNLDILDAFADPFNEEASFQGTGLPAGAPAGAIAFSSWEADDSDAFFGDLRDNLDDGVLDDADEVGPFSDVALTLGFEIGALNIGESFDVRLFITEVDPAAIPATGLLQTDLDTAEIVGLNGFGLRSGGPIAVPEPGMIWMLLLGLIGMAVMVRREEVRPRL